MNGISTSLPEVRFAVDRIIADTRAHNNRLTEASVKPLLNRTDPPNSAFIIRKEFHFASRPFFSGSIGDFLDRDEYQEVLRLLYLVEVGEIRAEPGAVARLKAFKDRGVDSRSESVAVWTVLTSAFSGVSVSATGGVLALISKNVRDKMPLHMVPIKKHWFTAMTIIASAGAVYGALDD